MPKYKVILSYDGHNYMGFQIQEELPTIELEIKNAFYKLLNKDVKIYPSGRTDKGVHAINQVIHFDLDENIPADGIKKGINSFLPADIYFKEVSIVDEDFHARFSAKSKEYRYYINIGEYDPLKVNYFLQIPYELNIDLMKEAIKKFEGIHDFKGFASSSIDLSFFCRTVSSCFISSILGTNCSKSHLALFETLLSAIPVYSSLNNVSISGMFDKSPFVISS